MPFLNVVDPTCKLLCFPIPRPTLCHFLNPHKTPKDMHSPPFLIQATSVSIQSGWPNAMFTIPFMSVPQEHPQIGLYLNSNHLDSLRASINPWLLCCCGKTQIKSSLEERKDLFDLESIMNRSQVRNLRQELRGRP